MEDKKARIIGPGGMSAYESNPENPREVVLKLAQKITDRMGEVTPRDPEYYGIAAMITDEMAEIALTMQMRTPYTLKQMSEMTGKDEKYLEDILFEMGSRGIIEFAYTKENHDRLYVLPRFVMGSAEYSNMKMADLKENPELASFFERMTFLPLTRISAVIPQGGAGIGMHVIPVEKAIPNNAHSESIEHISHWLDKYDGRYAAGPCSCRYGRAVLGEGCADDPEDWCIGVGDMADFLVESGRGHYVTREKVLEILQRAEDNGFVHQITNNDGPDKIIGICNCNVNICNALRTSQLFNTPNLSRSAYVAHVDTKNCVACGKCVEHCPAGAVKLGQKLCTNNGPIQYPKVKLPEDNHWGEFMWDYDYRDNNRKNCYDTGTAPCKTACPAHIAVQGYLKLAAQGKYKEALALIKKDNPFPAICGSICNMRCEDACTRGKIDQAVAIDAVKKFIAEQDLNAETRYIPDKVIPSNRGLFDEKIAIIGAGPSGLSCAYFLALKGYKPVVFEKNEKAGGMLTYGIPSYKLDRSVIDAEIDILRELGVEIRCGVEVGKDVTLDELRAQGYKGFYVAIGCQGGKLPGVTGEDAENVYTAVDFLKEVYADESKKLNGKVVVVGGGNVAIDAARVATRIDGKDVEIVCLEQENEMPASKQEIFEAKEEKVVINCGWGVKEVTVKEGKASGIVLKKCVSVYDENGKFAPVYDDETIKTIECDVVIFSIGQSIVYGDLLAGSKVEFGKGNTPIADSLTLQTAQEDVFVGGDVYSGPKFAIDAIAMGREAAESLHRFVKWNASLTIGRNRRDFIELDKNNIKIDSYDRASRQEAGMDETIDYRKSFQNAHKTLTEEQVRIETARCLGCGASIVDTNKCIGCGICTTKCEFDAIHLSRDLPGCSKMVPCEKTKATVLPNLLKRKVKLMFKKKPTVE